jgi:hypothetical protein
MKANKTTYRKRVIEVADLLVSGAETRDILQFASKNGWGLTDRAVYRYIQDAHQELGKVLDRTVEELRGRHLAQRRHLYRQAIKTVKDAQGNIIVGPDLRAALQILKDEAELQGLYPPTKIAPTNPDGTQQFDGGFAELLPELREAVERLRQNEEKS